MTAVEESGFAHEKKVEFCTEIPYFKKNKIKLLLRPKYFSK